MLKIRLTFFYFLAACFIFEKSYAAGNIINLPELPGSVLGQGGYSALGISGDGLTVVGVGVFATNAIKWTEAGGAVTLPSDAQMALAISKDASTIVGGMSDSGTTVAYRFKGSTLQSLGQLNGGNYSLAHAVNNDGSVVVGGARNGPSTSYDSAFIWTATSGMKTLGNLGVNFSEAYGVSGDGKIVVGKYDILGEDPMLSQPYTEPFRWTARSGMERLGDLNGGVGTSTATAISNNGAVIVGYAADGAAGGAQRAFRWTATDPVMRSLGTFSGGNYSQAYAVNANGTVIVGQSNGSIGYHAFRWTAATGMQSVADWLRSNGVTVATDHTYAAYAVSSDGNTIVGTTDNTNGSFYARASGLITLDDLNNSIQQSALSVSPSQVYGQARLALHGMHSTPLSRVIEKGKTATFFSGDIGRSNNNGYGGQGFGVGEAGVSHAFDLAQISLAAGQGFSNSNVADGKAQLNNTYGILSSLSRLFESNIYLNFDLLYQASNINSNRYYDNAGVMDNSKGQTTANTKAFRTRLDWKDLIKIEKFGLTPYVEYTLGSTRVKGYTENSGGFPIALNSRKQSFNEEYLGTDFTYQLSDKLKLRSKLEYGQIKDRKASSISGTVIGIGNFNYASAKNNNSWRRAGAGFEYDFGNQRIFSMANISDESLKTNYWLNVYYQIEL